MSLRNTFLLCATTMLVASACTSHRPVTSVEPGKRVRVRLERQGAADVAQLLRGDVVRVTSDSLVVRLHPSTDPTAIARRGIDRIELSAGMPSRFRSAVGCGASYAVMGMIERLIVARIADYEEDAWQSAATGAAYGAIVGVTIGAIRPQEVWRRVRDW